MAIYIRDKQGDLTALNIPAINGKSAYEVALSNGFEGTEKEWLDSLKGENGSEEVYIGTVEGAPLTASMVIDPEEDNEYDGFFTDSKYDYLGKEHSTLKAVNDNNIEHVLRRVSTQKYEGSSITANNTYMKQVNNVILKGVTKFKDLDTGEFLDSFEEGRNLELAGGNGKEIVISNSILRSLKSYDIIPGRMWQGNDDPGYSEIISIDNNSVTFNYISSWIRGFVIKNIAIKHKGKYTIEFTHSKKPKGWNHNIGININTYKNGVYLNQYYNNFEHFKFDNIKQRYYFEFDITEDCDSINISPTMVDGPGVHKFENLTIYNSSYKGITSKKESSLMMNTICYSISDVYDYIDLKTGTYVKNIEIRPYQSGDESNSEVLTDKKNTLYKLEQPIISKIDLQGQKIYSYDGVTHYTCLSEPGYPSSILSMEVPTDLASLVQEERAINQKLYNDQNTIIDSQLSLYESMSNMLLKDNNDIVPEYIQDLYELAYERGIRTRKQEVDINENTR